MIVYKLTRQNMTTYNNFKYEIDKIYKVPGNGVLCGKGWLHAYETPLLAVLHNPAHSNFVKPKIFKATTLNGKILKDHQVKLGSDTLKLLHEIDLPEITNNQRIAYGILCSLEVCKEETYVKKANDWLNNINNKKKNTNATHYATDTSAAYNTATITDIAIINITMATFYAATATVSTVTDTYYTAVHAAYAAIYSAYAKKIDLIEISEKAIKNF